MARPETDITINLKPRNGVGAKLELIHLGRGRFLVRRDGKRSTKGFSETTPTKFGRMIGAWVSSELPKVRSRDLQIAMAR